MLRPWPPQRRHMPQVPETTKSKSLAVEYKSGDTHPNPGTHTQLSTGIPYAIRTRGWGKGRGAYIGGVGQDRKSAFRRNSTHSSPVIQYMRLSPFHNSFHISCSEPGRAAAVLPGRHGPARNCRCCITFLRIRKRPIRPRSQTVPEPDARGRHRGRGAPGRLVGPAPAPPQLCRPSGRRRCPPPAWG